MADDYGALIEVTGLMQEQALDRHRVNLAESQRLAAELAQIDALRAAAQSDMSQIDARRLTGADTLWQSWLVRKRAGILRDMALARAHELDSLDHARTARARYDAAQVLQEAEEGRARKRRLAAEAETLDALGQMRRFLRGGS